VKKHLLICTLLTMKILLFTDCRDPKQHSNSEEENTEEFYEEEYDDSESDSKEIYIDEEDEDMTEDDLPQDEDIDPEYKDDSDQSKID